MILHKTATGENIVGKWGLNINCDKCTSEVEEGKLEIRQPQYSGVPLPFTAKLDIKRSGFLPGKGDETE